MAIKIAGTTVIDDSRNLTSIEDITLVGAINADGSVGTSGEVLTTDGTKVYWGPGTPTTEDVVGSYSLVGTYTASNIGYAFGDTIAGSSLRPTGFYRDLNLVGTTSTAIRWGLASTGTLSGTWRVMSATSWYPFSGTHAFLAVRIA